MGNITAPDAFFGYKLGSDRKIARWDKIMAYFDVLAKESDRILVENMGKSTEGNDFLKVTISSAENLKNLEEIRQTNLRIADPRGLSQAEIDELIKKGKAVCVQSMSLHASEIGGTQMAPLLAHKLCACDSEENLRILDNVVFIMVPCFNPDGQIMVTDYYNKYLDTEYEGCNYPSLYHLYTGHDNNRDAFAQNIVESKYMADILFHQWMPQSYQDHHHMGSYNARIQIAPYKNPLRPYVDPLTWRELNWYGASMAYRLDGEGLDGVSTGAQFPSWGHYGFHWITNSHNIAGMLTESASAKLASPKYIHFTQLQGNDDYVQPNYEAQTNFPNPWPGGWWRLSDIVERMLWSAYALLDTMARNPEQILKNMVTKALRQSKAGENSKEYAFIIPKEQHDEATAEKLIDILLGQNIEVHEAQERFKVKHMAYEKGDRVIFLSQPKYGVIMSLLGRTLYPDNLWTRDSSGALTAFDAATDTVAEYMGVEVLPANAVFEGKFERIGKYRLPAAPSVEKAGGYVLSAKENDSFHTVNLLLAKGCAVHRIEPCPWRDFYVECNADLMNEVLKKAPAKVRAVEDRPGAMAEIKPAKIAMYQRYYTGNADEGWTRLLFEQRAFGYTTLFDKDIIGGALADFDVLLLPSDDSAMLTGPKYMQGDPRVERLLMYAGPQPPEYQSGLGSEGAEAIRQFVMNGGRLLALNQSCDYAIDVCGLPVENAVKGLPLSRFNTHGSTLRVLVDKEDSSAYGMPEEALIVHFNGPVLDVKDKVNAHKYKAVVKYPEGDLLQSGLLTGGDLMNGRAAVMRAECGKGEVVLYGFSPQWRAQTHGTFKLLFNMLYV